MCYIQDRLDLFFVPAESRDTGLFCLKNRAYLDGKQVHQKFLIQNVLQRPRGSLWGGRKHLILV